MDPEKKPVEVYAERGETKLPEVSPEELKALALAYAKYLAEHDMEPGEPTFTDSVPEETAVQDADTEPEKASEPEETAVSPEAQQEEAETDPAEPEQEEAEEPMPEMPEEAPDDAGPAEEEAPEEPAVSGEEEASVTEAEQTEEADQPEEKAEKEKQEENEKEKTPAPQTRHQEKSEKKARKMFAAAELSQKQIEKLAAELERSGKKPGVMAKLVDLHDRLQTGSDEAGRITRENFIRASHNIVSTYRQSRRAIGVALLIIGIVAAVILAIFDKYTVYEYAYNGMTLGYVSSQEEITDVLDVAGTMMTKNSSGGTEIRFTANENVTFKLVDGRGKSLDDADTAVNKLVYMTDIETEAFGVYDGDKLAAVVKSNEDAEELLADAKAVLSEPDEGMKIVSAEFSNQLDIRPINVLLTSVQSNDDALEMMTEGGSMEIYHIVEEGEDAKSLSASFGTDALNIFNEDNSEVASDIRQGDKVCIHEIVDPVSVKLVETGRMKQIIEYETIKEESEDYYKGDTHTAQEGVDGIQIFEGTLYKIGGKVSRRDAKSIETVREKQDKIIIVGTAERPKTAPTGTYMIPLDHYIISSNFGPRWGRLHSGVDMAAPGGTPIYATDGGEVIRANYYSGYGNCIDIDHGNGRVTRYGHCSRILVNVGDMVYQGQLIGLVGSTGNSTGNHLHFEIRFNDVPTDPRPYLGI